MGIINHITTTLPRISLFGVTTVLYFLLIQSHEKGKISTTVLKCAPIISLIIFILFHGIEVIKQNKYAQRILCGLIFSCVGDALLNFNLFPHGMGAFAAAQVFYIIAFGFKPLKFQIGLILYAFAAAFVSLIFNNLTDILIFGLPIYAVLLSTMCWRSLAKAFRKFNIINILCAVGSILFVISDGCIAIDMFYSQIPNSTLYIMSTYYAAQFAITISILNELKSDKSNKSKTQANTEGTLTIKIKRKDNKKNRLIYL